MLGSYLAAAIRNLLRNRAYTLINLLGLVLGFTAAILIALYVRDEYSYDRFIPNHERIYQVGEIIEPPGRGAMRLAISAVTDASALQLAFPEIEATTRLAPSGARLHRPGDNQGTRLIAYWADPNFFEMFPWQVIAGNLSNALARPDGLVLTLKAARQLFGREDVVGQTLSVDRRTDMRVTAVIADLPANSHLDGEVFLPGVASSSLLTVRDAEQRRPGALRAENIYTYVQLRPEANIDDVKARLRAFADSHVPGIVNGTRVSTAYTFTLTPLADIHLQPRKVGEIKPSGDPRVVKAMLGIALLILIVACGNFVSMMTARATRRAIEVGVRKAVGATRRQIMRQFVGECLFYAMLAMVCAIITVDFILPAFNDFLQRKIVFDYLSDPVLAMGLIVLALLSGLAAGAYPAFYLSGFRPSIVLKGPTSLPNASRVRQLMVVFQFATLIALLVATLTVHRQTSYAIKDRMRVPTDQIYLNNETDGCPRALLDAIRNVEHVRSATCASMSALSIDHFTASFPSPRGDGTVATRAAPVDHSFFEAFGIEPLAGRLLSEAHGQDDVLRAASDTQDNPAVVINESAARALGFSSPAAAIGKFRQWQRLAIVDGEFKTQPIRSSQIVGVVPDFSIGSVRDAIEPTTYYLDAAWLSRLVLRFDGGAVQEGMESVRGVWTQRQTNSRFEGTFLSQYMNALYADIVTQSTIFSLFAGVAVVLAALGLLGLAIFTAERRTKEIGLRKVMGARRRDILVFLGWQFARPVLWANLIAWPCAWLAMQRWLQGFEYHTELGLSTFVIAGTAALIIALVTVWGHVLLVARANPVQALRYE